MITTHPHHCETPLGVEAIQKNNVWPPHYTLRYSKKARHTFLQITKTVGLEIVVPIRQKKLNIEQLLNEKKSWIQKNLDKLMPFIDSNTPVKKITPLPTLIHFQAIEETWSVFYQATASLKTKLTPHPLLKSIWIKGNIERNICEKLIKKWLLKLAKQHLTPWLYTLSLQTKLSFNRVLIRGQSTLWGSCNAKKNISLNYKLLFLPRTLAEHVLLHELCHIKYLNHSKRFWAFLNTFDEFSFENRKLLKKAECYVPEWLEK